MFRELKVFDGVNNVNAPHLIAPHQSTYSANAILNNGELTSHYALLDNGTTVTGNSVTYYKAQDEVVSSAEDRFYVEWAGLLYWSNSAGVLKRYDGTTVSNIGGHTAPASAPTLAVGTAGVLNGTYTYAVTYTYSSLFESPPCAFGSVSPANQKVTVTFTDTPGATVTHRNIYRLGGINPTFNLVATLPVATASYSDDIHDFDISRKELVTYNNDTAPSGLDMLVEIQGTFFGALGDKVYFSKEGQPEYWSDYNFVQFPKDVTGLGVFGNSVIAFTDSYMYMINGSNAQNISMSKLPFDYGCKNKRTVKNMEGRLIWVSALDDRDAICVFDGSSVQIINNFNRQGYTPTVGTTTFADYTTETYDAFTYTIQDAIVSNRKYFLFMSGRTAVVDVETEPKVYYMEDNITASYSKSNSLYVADAGGTVYEYYPTASTYRDITYRTGDIDDGDMTRVNHYRSLKIHATGDYSVSVYVDGSFVSTVTTEKSFLPRDTYGRYISFLIESNGYAKIKSISYEFTSLKD